MNSIHPAILDRTRTLTGPALRAAVDRLDADLARVAAYHLGWVDATGQPTSGGQGKAIRPTLAVLSAEAVGADGARALSGAVAVELIHNFSLLQDDLMDGDEQRRHRPAAWTVFGAPRTILAGDALLALAVQVVLQDRGPKAACAVDCLITAADRLIAGQSADLALEGRLDVTVEECLAMAADKTGALLACAASIGAVLADADASAVAALAGFGAHLGLAFQAVDDLLGIWGVPQVTGKPVGSDLRQGKRTLPVTAALAAGGPAAERLAGLLDQGDPATEEEVVLAAKLVEEAGGRAWTLAEAGRQLDLALMELDRVGAPASTCAELGGLARFVTSREL